MPPLRQADCEGAAAGRTPIPVHRGSLAVARTVLREPNLPVAEHDPVSMELRLLVDRRYDLVAENTATINRLMGRIHLLDPGHPTPANWQVQKAHRELRDWLITQDGLVAELARDELDDIIRVNAIILALRRRIERTVRPVAPDLIALQGCGELTAARIVAEVANIDRFRSEAAFARYAGLAPVPHTSGSAGVRLHSTRHGNRRLNAAIHRIALTQTIHDGPGKAYYQRRIAEGDSRHRSLRCLKRRITRVVFNRLKENAHWPSATQTGRGTRGDPGGVGATGPAVLPWPGLGTSAMCNCHCTSPVPAYPLAAGRDAPVVRIAA